MLLILEQKEQRERKEAGTQFEPHGHLSAGGPHACTRTDNEGWKERRDLRRGGGDEERVTWWWATTHHQNIDLLLVNFKLHPFIFPWFNSCFFCLCDRFMERLTSFS